MLARDTDWRQGNILTRQTAALLGLVETADDEVRAIIITHDCDISHEAEHCIEVILADVIGDATLDPQLSYAKNPRRLHLAYDAADGSPLILELRQGNRHAITKDTFAKYAARDDSVLLPTESKRVLKQWLAARYGRPAFPNAFENRLSKRSGKREVKNWVGRILEPEARHLVGLFFDLGEQRWTEVAEDEPYVLSISVVYDAVNGGSSARESAERVAKQLRDLFEKAYGTPDIATEIALDACEAVPDTHMTLADLRRVDQWRLEYVSLRDDEQGGFLPVGEIPA